MLGEGDGVRRVYGPSTAQVFSTDSQPLVDAELATVYAELYETFPLRWWITPTREGRS